MLQEKLVLYEAQDQISYVTLNRPDKLNALNAALRGELEAAFLQADEDQDTKVVV